MGKGKSGSSGSTTTVQKADPWIGAQQYLLGENGNPGVFPSAANQFNAGNWTSGMQGLTDNYLQGLQSNSGLTDTVLSKANDAMRGYYDPVFSAAGGITGPQTITGQQVDPTQAFSSMGAANPTSALSRLLSGQSDTSALNGYMDSAMGRLTDNFNRSVMPSIRGNALLSGQYGGSRQGVAEGLATDALSDSMSDLSANMYNNAYNTAQSNMYGTANNLSGLAINNAQSNAQRDLAAQQANAGYDLETQRANADIALRNNEQSMQSAAQQMGNLTGGANLLTAGMGLDTNAYQNALAAMQAPSGYNWGNLNNYANIISSGAGMGGTKSATEPLSPANPLSSIAGGGLAGAGIGKLMAGSAGAAEGGIAALGGWAPMTIGAGLGLLGAFQ